MPFGDRIRQVGNHHGPQPPESFGQDGGSGHTVNVKVPEHGNRFAGSGGGGQPGQRLGHAGQRQRVVRQPGRLQESGQGCGVADASGQQQLRGGRR